MGAGMQRRIALWVSASAFFNVYLQVGVGGAPSRPQQAQFAPVVSTSLAALLRDAGRAPW